MKAGFYQFNPSFGHREENLNRVLSALKDEEFNLLVLPEFFATGYQFISLEEVAGLAEPVPDGSTTKALSGLSRQKNGYIVAGLPEEKDGRYYNSAILCGPDGFIGVYRKTHLYFEEKLYFTPGDTGFRVWDTDIGRIGIMICFDWFFPESARTLALSGAEIIAHPANLVLPYCPDAMPLRCLENMVFAITANRTGTEKRKDGQALRFIGKSGIVSPRGEILARAPEDKEALLFSEINLSVAKDKTLNSFNNLFKDRRPDSYKIR